MLQTQSKHVQAMQVDLLFSRCSHFQSLKHLFNISTPYCCTNAAFLQSSSSGHGALVALLGPSGSGKTTLLEADASGCGRQRVSKSRQSDFVLTLHNFEDILSIRLSLAAHHVGTLPQCTSMERCLWARHAMRFVLVLKAKSSKPIRQNSKHQVKKTEHVLRNKKGIVVPRSSWNFVQRCYIKESKRSI